MQNKSDKIITIALDAMSGDLGSIVPVSAAVHILKKEPTLKFILVGDKELLSSELQKLNATTNDRLQIWHASQVVEMDESPAHALRGKKDSSMRVAINLVKQGKADACVSSGNTGALMATSRFVLKTLPGIDRPAICSTLPTTSGHTHVLDLGANVDSTAEHLFEFAVMGSVLVASVDAIENPKVSLLNIGAEDMKGNEQVKEASALISESDLNYTGFIEGDGIYSGEADVVVCDGFVGNVMLKTSEGVAKMISHYMKQEFKRNPLKMLAGIIATPVLRAFKKRIDPRAYNGASFLGLQGIVVKSHGGADEFAFGKAIMVAKQEVISDVPSLINQKLEVHLSKRKEN